MFCAGNGITLENAMLVSESAQRHAIVYDRTLSLSPDNILVLHIHKRWCFTTCIVARFTHETSDVEIILFSVVSCLTYL